MSTSRRGFTLLELLISTAIAMVMASIATTAYFQLSKAIARSEARMTMFSSAQRLYTQWNRVLATVQPSCAIVIKRVAGSEVRFIFMRAKEENWDFEKPTDGNVLNRTVNSDLVWEEWIWNRSTQVLKAGSNSLGDESSPGRSFSPSIVYSPAGVNYRFQKFQVVPQPRRTLDVTNPIDAATNSLNDNVYFPSVPVPVPAVSLADPDGDVGDFTDLERNLVPVLDRMSDFSCDIVTHNGTLITIDDSGTATTVFNGVWLDGRMAPTLSGAPVYGTSELANRPRIMRIRFTLTDVRIGVSSTFSFSFNLPDLAQ